MALEIMRDARIRSVEWRDLVQVSTWEIVKEIILSLPWLVASLALANQRWYVAALACSFVFFLCGLRQVHNAYHYALGLPRIATEWIMFGMSCLMLSAMHALQQTHLHHHSHCLDADDVEAASARMKPWEAIFFGPYFYFTIHRKGLERANARQLRWIAAEIGVIAVWIPTVLFALDIPMLKYHVAAMLVGQCLTAFFAVWTVHHDCDPSHFIARTLRNPFKSLIAFDMFYHVEHHLYPKVPTCHLGTLSKRLDAVAPELKQMQVF